MNAPVQIAVPDGMKVNAKGHFVPVSKIEDVDLARDDLVTSVFEKAEKLQHEIIKAKNDIQNDIAAFLELSAEQYGVLQGGKKGNITLNSYDGQYRVNIAIRDRIEFDERLQTAKQLIDECVIAWSDDSNDNVKALINHAFQVDKAGNINTGRVLSLLNLKINDEKWSKAMEAIRDSIHVTETKQYIHVYKRNADGAYERLNLEFSKL